MNVCIVKSGPKKAKKFNYIILTETAVLHNPSFGSRGLISSTARQNIAPGVFTEPDLREINEENICEPFFSNIDVSLTNLKYSETEDGRYPFSNDFSGYSTVLYGEGEYALNYIKTEQVNGFPIIFVPGNAGSSKQVRSLGSILHNKTESRNLPFTFDVFAIDFNEELSGLSGMYLERQIKYLELVVRHIWDMYLSPPHGIIFVGHSMGGIVIRSLLRSVHFDPARIAFIVTLGTPHKDAPMVFDWYLKNIYDRMHDSWRDREKELARILVLSVSGGLKDHLVPEHFTFDNGIRHISTTAVDGIELETDHLCIVWCNQLVRYISRLVIEYAYHPESFHERSDNIVKQLFDADGLLRELAPMTFSASTEHSFYTLIHSSVAEQISVHLEPQRFFKAIALREDPAKLDSVVHIGLLSLLKGCFTFLWKLEFEDHKPAILLPIYFRSPVIAVVISLKLESCSNASEWFAKVEFRSQDLRRMSSLLSSKELQIVGYLLNKKETKAEVFFILNQCCRFRARLGISYLDTLIVLTDASNVWIRRSLHVKHIYTLCAINYHISWVDWFTLLISSLMISSFTYILQKLADLFFRLMESKHSERYVKSRGFNFNEVVVIAISLFINYSYNGFFALLIVVIPSSLQLVRSVNFSKTASLSSFFHPNLLAILHLYVVLVYAPFGFCSMWNIIKYGLFAVHEDPARIPAYFLVSLKLIRLCMGNMYFFKAELLAAHLVRQNFNCTFCGDLTDFYVALIAGA
uniref:GPI inositol-deacylase n=1 Tax=Setaria digitata TaxID=48799 RepID=A0A915Q115_9BILA